MIEKSAIDEELAEMNTLRTLVRAYEEIASIRMKKIRDQVLASRSYLDAINEIFDEVRLSYSRQTRALAKKRGRGKNSVTFLAHNGKSVDVLLSANTGLYGEIVQSTFEKFIASVRTGYSEVTIVGRHGLSLFLGVEPDKPYTFFELPDHGFSKDELDRVIRHMVQYEEIHVFYGKFINVINQQPDELTIAAEIKLSDERPISQTAYIFEPTLENILVFFETEIFGSLFEQAVRESQLAKFASRVIAMDKADNNIRDKLNRLNTEKMRVNHKLSNRKQINSLSSIRAAL